MDAGSCYTGNNDSSDYRDSVDYQEWKEEMKDDYQAACMGKFLNKEIKMSENESEVICLLDELKRRDDEILALKSQVEQLTRYIKVYKSNVAKISIGVIGSVLVALLCSVVISSMSAVSYAPTPQVQYTSTPAPTSTPGATDTPLPTSTSAPVISANECSIKFMLYEYPEYPVYINVTYDESYKGMDVCGYIVSNFEDVNADAVVVDDSPKSPVYCTRDFGNGFKADIVSDNSIVGESVCTGFMP